MTYKLDLASNRCGPSSEMRLSPNVQISGSPGANGSRHRVSVPVCDYKGIPPIVVVPSRDRSPVHRLKENRTWAGPREMDFWGCGLDLKGYLQREDYRGTGRYRKCIGPLVPRSRPQGT